MIMYLDPAIVDRPPYVTSHLPHATRAASSGLAASRVPVSPPPEGFTRHLKNAIILNLGRAPGYAKRSGGASWPVSLRLIVGEIAILPAALYFDLSSRPFLARGIPVVTGDFTAMATVRMAAEAPHSPIPTRPEAWTWLHRHIAFYQRVIEQAAGARDFVLVALACADLLDIVDRFEATEHGPMAMTRHIVESIGVGAVHAADAKRRSDGDTDSLYATFIGFQILGLSAGADLDRAAYPIYRQGVGVITNDVPVIPFAATWSAYLQAHPPVWGLPASPASL